MEIDLFGNIIQKEVEFEFKPTNDSPFVYMNNISNKTYPDNLDGYSPFLTNLGFSQRQDSVLYANEMNKYTGLDNKLQYEFLLNSIRPKKRFAKWSKPEQNDDLDIVSEFYNYSLPKARQALNLLNENQLRVIRESMTKGIKDNDNNR